MTRWSRDVSPTNAWPDYPRPQLVRPEWQNLNGLWNYAVTPATDQTMPGTFDGRILVPFPIESALSGVMKPFLPDQKLWYQRSFRVPPAWTGRRVLLHFDAVDFDATVTLNGRTLGEHKGGYDRFTFDITDDLRPGLQDLRVLVTDPTNEGDQAHGKQSLHPGGASYTATSGIWQTVWIEPVARDHVERLDVQTDLTGLRVNVIATAAGLPVTVEVDDGKAQVAAATGVTGTALNLTIPQPKLWAPDHPFLYTLKIQLGQDRVTSYAGLRTIAVAKDDQGVERLMLNGKALFECGPLDQGFWPDGIYTAPTDAALRSDLEYVKAVGFNMVRKHMKVEPDRWYYWADRLGVLVWQDMPSGNLKTPASRGQWEAELARHVTDLAVHPSIVLWVLFNEGWGQYDTARLVNRIRQLDPTRLVDNGSGWYDHRWGDVVDEHFYPGPGVPCLEEHRASVTGEFGGLGFLASGHLWRPDAWSYQMSPDRDALTAQFERLWARVYDLKRREGLAAAVYTQLTDVEQEANGLLSYDRAVEKIDRDRLRAAVTDQLPSPKYTDILPDSWNAAQTWRTTASTPPADWAQPDFDATGWEDRPGGFGSEYGMRPEIRTPWKTVSLWLRRDFYMPAGGFEWPLIQMHYGEDAEIFVNGVVACRPEGFLNTFGRYEMAPEARATLHPGRNVLAVHLMQRNKGGEEYVDLGLVDEHMAGLPGIGSLAPAPSGP